MSAFENTHTGPDDPRLTAYALGEMDEAQRAAFEAMIAADPALQAAVEEIRDTAERLESALAAEPIPEPRPLEHLQPYRTVRPPRLFRMPYWGAAALAAAACLAVILTVRQLPSSRDAAQRRAMSPSIAGSPTVAVDKATGTATVQPGNPLDIVFPKEPGEVGSTTPGAESEKWAFVVPHAPKAEAAAPANDAAADRSARQAPSGGVRDGVFASAAASPDSAADNDFRAAATEPLSTFPVDVGTASYDVVRRSISDGRRPPRRAVRIEELLNAFAYGYAGARPDDPAPFGAALEVASAPWAPAHRLVRIGLKGRGTPDPDRAAPVVASQVRVQVEFNPARVRAYRLIGYEDRRPERREAEGGALEASDLRAGQAVTALYEVIPVGVAREPGEAAGRSRFEEPSGSLEGMRAAGSRGAFAAGELLTVSVRYQIAGAEAGRLAAFPLVDRGTAFADASDDFKFAAAVAGFGLVLRDSPHRGSATLSAVEQWAGLGLGADLGGRRADFVSLVRRAERLPPIQG